MMCDASLWSKQTKELGDRHTLTVADITRADTIAEIAEQVLDDSPEHFALAGLSMGGIVAMEMWRRAPQRIERLALLDTNFRSDSNERKGVRDRQIADVTIGGLEYVLRDELKPQYLALCHQDNLVLLEEVLAMGLALGPEVFLRQSLALRDRPDSTETLTSITCPTLILCGQEDRLCTPELHREMAQLITDAELQIIPACGHLSTLEQPKLVNQALSHWIDN
ncbi:MAG: alpha/beta fold hydrolase [Halieaceae bacterium]